MGYDIELSALPSSCLCLQRYFNVSVTGTKSYRATYVLLETAFRVSQLDLLAVHTLEKLFKSDLPTLCHYKDYHKVREHILYPLPIISSTVADTMAKNSFGFLTPPSSESFVTIRRCKEVFPKLPVRFIREKYRHNFPQFSIACHRRFQLGHVVDIAVEHYGSFEKLQADQLVALEKHEEYLQQLLPYYGRQGRLQQLASKLFPMGSQDVRLIAIHCPLLSIGASTWDLDSATRQPDRWVSDICMQWANACCKAHPVLRHYLQNTLIVSVDDYIEACILFEERMTRSVGLYTEKVPTVAIMSVYQKLGQAVANWQRSEPLTRDILVGMMLGLSSN